MFVKFNFFPKILLFLFLISLSSVANANNQPAPDAADKCLVHLDKSFYVSGEIIWYKVYLSQEFKSKAVNLRATVVNPQGNIIHSSFIKTEGNTYISGYYQIPFNLKSGMYLLQFTGINKASKKTINLVQSQVPIYNDLEGVAKMASNKSAASLKKATVAANNDLKVNIQLAKNTFSARENIRPVITLTDNAGNPVAGNISVSVVDYNLIGDDLMQSNNQRQGEAIDPKVVSILGDKIYIKGSITKEDGSTHQAKVLGAYSRDEDKLLYTKTNAEGEFYLAVDDFHGDRSFQILGQQTEYENIRVKENSQAPFTKFQELPLNDKIAEYLRLSRLRKKIFQRYAGVESNLVMEKYPTNKKTIKSDGTFITKEYEDFEFMSIFFKENLTPLRFQFQKSDSTYLAKMYNPKNQSAYEKFFKGKPLFIVDGIATRNGDFIARMRMADVEKVELFYNLKKVNKQYKLFGSNGVTKIKTYDQIESLPVFEANNIITINGLQKAAAFPVFNPTQLSNNAQPFFRPQLYWNPTIMAKKDGKAEFSYFQTDDRSKFKINVVAQSEDGRIGYGELIYEVK
jgi:hypothetical protein